MESKQQEPGLSLVRAAAGVLVLSVHFFLNSGFYTVPLAGKSMLLAVMVRMACMSCVPMFLLLTGYLCIGRKWSTGYYWKLLPILLSYLLAGAACMAFRILWLGNSFTIGGFIKQFTVYTAAPYGWYIEMYIGLFLLSPFLNAAWHGLDERGQRALVLTLLALTAVPPLVNSFQPLLPGWWTRIYPLTYYALGAWLREHPIKWKVPWLLLGWAAAAAAAGMWSYVSVKGAPFVWSDAFNWPSIVLTVPAVLLFSALKQWKGDRTPAPVRWCIERVARLSLSMYLISYIPDQLIYPILAQAVPEVHRRVFCMPLVVGATVICSCLLAQVIEWAVAGIMALLRRGDRTG